MFFVGQLSLEIGQHARVVGLPKAVGRQVQVTWWMTLCGRLGTRSALEARTVPLCAQACLLPVCLECRLHSQYIISNLLLHWPWHSAWQIRRNSWHGYSTLLILHCININPLADKANRRSEVTGGPLPGSKSAAVWTDHSSPPSRLRECVQPVAYRGMVGSNPPPPEIPKALQNRANLAPIVKTDKSCWI